MSEKFNNTTLSDRIKMLRKTLGRTQKQFADELCVSIGAVSQYESGSTNPSRQTLHLMCTRFGVSESWLVDGIEPMMDTSEDAEQTMIDISMQGQSEHKKRLMRMVASMPDEFVEQLVAYWEATKKE